MNARIDRIYPLASNDSALDHLIKSEGQKFSATYGGRLVALSGAMGLDGLVH